jgi:hypothetical protein
MFNTQCVRQWSFVSSGFVGVGAGESARVRLVQRVRAGIDEPAIVFTGAAIGLAGSTAIVLRALWQAF